jgi:hypothetical protein
MRTFDLPIFYNRNFCPRASSRAPCESSQVCVYVCVCVCVCVWMWMCVCVCMCMCPGTLQRTQLYRKIPHTQALGPPIVFLFSIFCFLFKKTEPTPPRIPIEALGTPAPPRATKASAAPHLGSAAAGGRQSKCGSTRDGGGGGEGGGVYSQGGVEEEAGSMAVGLEVCTTYQYLLSFYLYIYLSIYTCMYVYTYIRIYKHTYCVLTNPPTPSSPCM